MHVCDAYSFETKAVVLLSWLIDQTLNVVLDKFTVLTVFKVTLRTGKSFDLDFADTVVRRSSPEMKAGKWDQLMPDFQHDYNNG